METANCDMTDRDVSSQTLAEQTLSHVQARNSDLSNWRIMDCSVLALSMVNSRFNYCVANKSRWDNWTMDHCMAEHGFFSDCSFDRFSVQSSFFTGSRFVNCRFDQTAGELTTFGLCVFRGAQWHRSRLSEVSFINSYWQECEFYEEDFSFVRFPSSVFVNTRFVNCMLRKVIFRKATFLNCSFETCKLPESVFHQARFQQTQFKQTDIHEAANIEGIRGLAL